VAVAAEPLVGPLQVPTAVAVEAVKAGANMIQALASINLEQADEVVVSNYTARDQQERKEPVPYN
jgi:hypothetical protein